jgi:hypothetical protein
MKVKGRGWIERKTKKPLIPQGFVTCHYGDLDRVRTCDPYPVKIVLSQLSYQIKKLNSLVTSINIPNGPGEVNLLAKKIFYIVWAAHKVYSSSDPRGGGVV